MNIDKASFISLGLIVFSLGVSSGIIVSNIMEDSYPQQVCIGKKLYKKISKSYYTADLPEFQCLTANDVLTKTYRESSQFIQGKTTPWLHVTIT